MLKSNSFLLQFSGLKLGKHVFECELDPSFFESCDQFGILTGKGMVDVCLEKKETMMLLSLNLKSSIQTLCDRCNENMALEVKGDMNLIYKFGSEESLDESLVILPHDSYQMDLYQPIYELFIVSLPTRLLHDEKNCDQEIIQRLRTAEQQIKENVNIDPRWSDLDKLNNN